MSRGAELGFSLLGVSARRVGLVVLLDLYTSPLDDVRVSSLRHLPHNEGNLVRRMVR